MRTTQIALACIKLVEKHVDLLDMPVDSNEHVYLDYDATTLRLRYLVAVPMLK